MLTKLEKRVIAILQHDIPIIERPYRVLAEQLGITEQALLDVISGLCDRRIIRRFGATLRHQKSGFEANAMTAWQVAPDRVEEVGKILAGFEAVSHCYHRNPAGDWPYNLYTMIHATDEQACRDTARQMAETTGIETYTLLFSRRELKKTSMRYFSPDGE